MANGPSETAEGLTKIAKPPPWTEWCPGGGGSKGHLVLNAIRCLTVSVCATFAWATLVVIKACAHRKLHSKCSNKL